MAINDWWAGEDAERLWMEITDREDLGVDLNAPTLNGAGREEWGYTLVTETKPGDIVLHWHRNLVGRPALVGWSTITGPLSIESNYTWMAHGTRGRERGRPTTGQGWRMPCRGFERLEHPIDKARLAELETRLKETHELLTRQVQGPIYFPFMFYRPGEVRAAQSYMAKFPAALIPLFAELSDLVPAQPTTARNTERRAQVDGGVRRVQDAKLRRAVEEHAVRAANRYYTDQGATKVEELGKPYDLRVIGLGPERHVEVKGSSVAASAIELTVNEVTHAHNHKPTDLVVVDQISVRRGPDGEYATSGGVLRVWTNWEPDKERLAPTQFRYSLD